MNYSTIFISIKLGITTLIPGTITVVSATRKVNRLNRVYVNITVDVPIENQPQIIASGTGCTYDNNGNLTSDPSRGILDIEWSETGKPLRVSFVSGEEICYRYAATGEKLSEVFVDTDGSILRRRDIYGSYELTDGSLDRTQVGGGYLDSRGVFHVYVTDYQGNVIGIVNAKTGTPVQFTDYYPYGIPHATAYSPEANRRKFGGKEYTSEFGFSSCDFGARLYSPLLCVFDSLDPKASTYTHISPYTYCAADPVNLIDPTGEIPTALEGAYIANHVYDGKLGDVLYGGWKMIKCYTSKESISFRGGLYQKRHEDVTIEYAFATAGTYPLSTESGENSLKEDILQPFGLSIDMKTSIWIADKLSKSYPNNELTFVGHSKAGAEAEANAYKTGRNALLYNPAILNDKKYGLNATFYTEHNPNGIIIYVMKGEFLSYINKLTKLFVRPSKQNHKVILKGNKGNSIDKHTMETMIESLRDNGYR